jgi:hypothetical protein
VIVYHHADRSAPVSEQAQRRLADVAEELGIDPLGAVRASRGSCRLFLVLPSEDHREHFTTRFERIEESPWRSELTVYRSAARPVCR